MSPCELTAAITAIANGLARKMTDDELELWAVVLTQLGDTLATIVLQRSLCQK